LGGGHSTAYADDNPLNILRDDALSFFKPLKGRIVSLSDGSAVVDIGANLQVKKGMRVTIFREGMPFIHPVTKERIGLLETMVGKAEVTDVNHDTSTVKILSGDVKKSDRLRISETGVRILFYPTKNVDWGLADSYYRILKDTGRFELIDTALETENDAEIIAEAKKLNADVALILSAKEAAGDTMIKQRLLWVDNSVKFAEDEVRVMFAFMKELKFGEEFFGRQTGDVRLFVDLPFGVRLIASGDVDGDGKAELLMSTGRDVRLYMPGSSGALSSLYEIKGAASDDHLWLDVIDINKNGKDEVVITSLNGDEVISRVYELADAKFSVVWEGKVFLKRIGNELFAQEYEKGEGYKGPVFKIVWNNGYKKGDKAGIPKDVNLYDFVYINEPDGRRLILAYDELGYLNLYNNEGIKIWRSREDYGGFLTKFKKASPTIIVDKGEWAIKDRLFQLGREVFVIKRVPLVGVAKGMGYSKSQLRSLWWTGVSMEERVIIDNIPGNALDYTVADSRVIVLDKPSLMTKFKNIFKGESPFGTVLYMYSLKGRL